jgi:putative NADPH-quinone reductase
MTILIILGHPSAGSFNHAIAQTASGALTALGHQVILHDLYAEGFDPVLPAAELARDAALPPGIARHIEEVCTADGLVIVHPNWWSQPPAIVRGWTDRVLRAGRAYRFVPDGRGGGKSEGLLRARAGIVFNTANTPQEKEVELYGDPLELLWRRVVFGLCGVPTVCRRNFSPVIVSTPAQRDAWLREVRDVVSEHFPRS